MNLENIQNDQTLSQLLVELTSLDGLSFPTSSSKRNKFTCIDASTRYLVLGTTTGTVYVFSRYRQKRSAISGSTLPPVDVFLIKDGPVNTIVVSPNEQYIGIGSDSGRISVVNLLANEQKSSIIYSVPGDARKPDKVGALCWNRESKVLIAGHCSGVVNLHRFDARSVFRSSHDTLCDLTSEIFQIDINSNNMLLISTSSASHVYDIETNKLTQVGKKPRNAKMGACFLESSEPDQTCGVFIVAARPNGRIWECNTAGVVYRTHQLRLSPSIPRCSIISFRHPFQGQQKEDENSVLESAINMDVNFGLLYRINSETKSLALTCSGSKFIIADPDSSQVVLMTDIHEDILGISVCGSDLFVLLSGATFLKKFSLMSLSKAAEKLKTRGSFYQAAQLILQTAQLPIWEKSFVSEVIEGLSKYNKKNESEYKQLKIALLSELDRVGTVSSYDNIPKGSVKHPNSSRLPSGVYRVHSSNVPDDHFASYLPNSLRDRSLSSPNLELGSPNGILQKRASMPITNDEVKVSQTGSSENVRADILTKARELLETDGQITEVESLRVLLQLDLVTNNDVLRFVPTVTTANVARTLAELSISPRVDLPRIAVERKNVGVDKIRRSGPTIVKPIRPQQIKKAAVVKNSAIQNVAVAAFDVAPHIEPNSNCVISNKEVMNTDISCNDHENNEVEILEGEWLHNRLQALTSPQDAGKPFSGMVVNEENNEYEESEPPTPLNIHCQDCGIHRSWIGVSLLALVCRRIKIEKDLFNLGSVPSTYAQWLSLFQKRFTKSKGSICPKCEVCIESAKKISVNSNFTKPAVRQKSSAEKLRERIINGDETRLRQILFSSNTKQDGVELEGETLVKVEEQPSLEDEGPCEGFMENLNWITTIDIKSLISICCIVMGVSDYLKLARQLPMLKLSMDDDCWALLVVLIIREHAMRDRLVHQSAINDIISTLGLEGFLTPDNSQESSPRKRNLSRNTSPPLYSWIVDCKSICPICTLSLRMEGNIPEIVVRSFSCGHSYHTPCLSGKQFCIACQLRARRTAAQSRTVRQ